jgi:hypothetical protein
VKIDMLSSTKMDIYEDERCKDCRTHRQLETIATDNASPILKLSWPAAAVKTLLE